MSILKNIREKLIAHTSPHKSKDSMFSEKINEFCNKISRDFSPFGQIVHHDKSVPFTGTLKMLLYQDNFCNRDSFKMAQQLTGSVCLIAFFGRPDSSVMTSKSMRETLFPLIKFSLP
jgi:hypothetical protein